MTGGGTDRTPRALTLAGLAGLSVMSAACRPRASAPLHVEYAGCLAVLRGPVCVPKADRPLTVWIAGPAGPSLRVSGARLVGDPVPVQDGVRRRLELDGAASRITISGAAGSWSIGLGTRPTTSWAEDFDRLWDEGRLDEADALVRQHLDTGPDDERGRAASALARVELRRGRQAEARDLLRRAVADHRARGFVLNEVNDATLLVFTLLHEAPHFDEARSILASLPQADGLPAEAAYWASYYDGRLAGSTADLRRAVSRLSEARGVAERLDLEHLRRSAEVDLAEVLQLVGRREEAEGLLEGALARAPQDLPACERVKLLAALGLSRVRAGEVGDDAPDPRPLLEEALRTLGQGCVELPAGALTLRVNLALANLQRHSFAAGRAWLLPDLERANPTLELALWHRDVEARLDLAQGRPALALARYQELGRLAEATLEWGARWRAVAGRALALARLGRRDAALRAFAEAEGLLDQDSLHVPLQDGRDAFVAGREPVIRAHLDLLLAAERWEEAFQLGRRSARRVLASLQLGERLAGLDPEARREWDRDLSAYRTLREEVAADADHDWRLPADQLDRLRDERRARQASLSETLDRAFARLDQVRPSSTFRMPRGDEVILAFHPLPKGEVGFAASSSGLKAVRLDCLATPGPPDRLARCLLAPFTQEIRAARQVTLLLFGPSGRVDFHALAFEGAPLLAGRTVSWSLDLPEAPERPAAAAGVALLVADPKGDLPASRAEIGTVEGALRSAPRTWRVERLEARQATDAEVRRRLPEADLFHFAGHATFSGRGGWDSVLPLADSGALTVADILALEQAPRWAVLSGCDTSRPSGRTSEGLGIAQAFLTRGTQAVVASSRPVGDATAAAVVGSFYGYWSQGLPMASALQRAQLAVRERDPGVDWAAFRLVER